MDSNGFVIMLALVADLLFLKNSSYNGVCDSDVEEDQRTSNEFMADLNAEYHERALLKNQKRIDDLTKRKSEKGKNEKGKSEKGFIAESFDWDEESIPSEDKGTTKIRAFMAIAEDEPSVGKVMCCRVGSII
ncbi:hypothetical protein Tco_1170717 [Tanacetum coccineum]